MMRDVVAQHHEDYICIGNGVNGYHLVEDGSNATNVFLVLKVQHFDDVIALILDLFLLYFIHTP